MQSTGPGGFGMDRPTTAASQAKQLQDSQEELKIEWTNNKRLTSEIQSLKAELSKNSMISGSTSSEGRINCSGVREIDLDEISLGEQLG